jgi:hypothetical protein
MDHAGSLAYDREVRLQTVRVAMCDWMVPLKAGSMWKVPESLVLTVGCYQVAFHFVCGDSSREDCGVCTHGSTV